MCRFWRLVVILGCSPSVLRVSNHRFFSDPPEGRRAPPGKSAKRGIRTRARLPASAYGQTVGETTTPRGPLTGLGGPLRTVATRVLTPVRAPNTDGSGWITPLQIRDKFPHKKQKSGSGPASRGRVFPLCRNLSRICNGVIHPSEYLTPRARKQGSSRR